MSPDRYVALTCAFALGVLVMDVAHDLRAMDPPPSIPIVAPAVVTYTCAHHMATGHGWRCM